MILSRRSALFGLLAAPAIIRTPGLLMPVKPRLTRVGRVLVWGKDKDGSIVFKWIEESWAVIPTYRQNLSPSPREPSMLMPFH